MLLSALVAVISTRHEERSNVFFHVFYGSQIRMLTDDLSMQGFYFVLSKTDEHLFDLFRCEIDFLLFFASRVMEDKTL